MTEVRIESLVHGGDGLGHVDGQVVFVPFSIPGELVEVEITDKRPDYLRGRIERVLEASPDRVEPPCTYFGECGGCQWQHIAYPRQLFAKQAIVREQLERIGRFVEPPVLPVIGVDHPWYYRNQARFSARRSGHLGFTRIDNRWFIQIDHCRIMQAPINAALDQLQGRAIGKRLHQVAVRSGARTGDLLVNPLIGDGSEPVPSGQPFYEESLLGRRFRVSPSSFFQVATKPDRRDLSKVIIDPPPEASQAEVLVLLARDRLKLSGVERLVDAYCGVGVFALLLAPYCREVIAIEESASSLRDARANLGDTANVQLVQAKVEAILPTLPAPVDAVVIDPPRAGCKPEVIAALLRLQPVRICYVSCEPATLARDLRLLVDGGYRLEEVQPVDLFPQTHHIESVSTLVRESAG